MRAARQRCVRLNRRRAASRVRRLETTPRMEMEPDSLLHDRLIPRSGHHAVPKRDAIAEDDNSHWQLLATLCETKLTVQDGFTGQFRR
jgi:hypothetical protein